MALDDHFFDSQELFARVDAAQANSRHASELRRRLEIDPNDPTAAFDLQQLTESAAPDEIRFQHRSQLYLAQCSACHGAHGQADGRAARFLFPRPRNLRQDRIRLVSTLNTIPCRGDIERVIRNGIPGTSMPAFPKLTQAELSELVDVVEEFRREGTREQLTLVNQQAELEIDARTIDELVAARTKPSDLLSLPAIGEATPAAIERGQIVYEAAGCGRCHGPRGSPALDLWLLDDAGRTVIPRDLVHDPMQGGADAEALYRRIRLGMPGSPHPGLADVTEEQLSDLVHFCRSLSVEPKLPRTNQERAMQAARPSDT
jgi:mono/diheme cytochrome c family protein